MSDNSDSIDFSNNLDDDCFMEKKYEKLLFDNDNNCDNLNEELTLHNCLRKNMRGIKTIYYILLTIQIFEVKFRNNCKCCISNDVKLLQKQYDNGDQFIPIEYKITFTI